LSLLSQLLNYLYLKSNNWLQLKIINGTNIGYMVSINVKITI